MMLPNALTYLPFLLAVLVTIAATFRLAPTLVRTPVASRPEEDETNAAFRALVDVHASQRRRATALVILLGPAVWLLVGGILFGLQLDHWAANPAATEGTLLRFDRVAMQFVVLLNHGMAHAACARLGVWSHATR